MGVSVDQAKTGVSKRDDCARGASGLELGPNMSSPLEVDLPSTSRSKSLSPTSPVSADPLALLELKRLFATMGPETLFVFDDNSLNFLVCSCSILDDKALISFM